MVMGCHMCTGASGATVGSGWQWRGGREAATCNLKCGAVVGSGVVGQFRMCLEVELTGGKQKRRLSAAARATGCDWQVRQKNQYGRDSRTLWDLCSGRRALRFHMGSLALGRSEAGDTSGRQGSAGVGRDQHADAT